MSRILTLFALFCTLHVPVGGEALANDAWWDNFDSAPDGQGVFDPDFDQVTAFLGFEGNLVVAGDFTDAGGVTASNIAIWSGSAWTAMGDGFDQAPTCLAVYRGELYAAGYFGLSGTTSMSGIARWDGAAWQPVGEGLQQSSARAMAVHDDKLFVGGSFVTPVGDYDFNFLAVWDGATWSQSGVFMGRIEALAVYDNTLFAAGLFSYIRYCFTEDVGYPCDDAHHIAQFDGSWRFVGTGTDGRIRALSVHDGKLIAGGAFTSAGGSPANNIAAWDGSDWSALEQGVNHEVFALAPFQRDLAVGGRFTEASGETATRIARWNGTSWSTFGSGLDDEVGTLRQEDGYLYVGGRFSNAGGSPSNCIARWDTADPTPIEYVIDAEFTGHFPTLQYAADAVAEQDLITLEPGLFDEDIFIRNKWPTVSGSGVSTEIRSLDWSGTGVQYDNDGQLTQVTVQEDCKVNPSGHGFTFQDCRFESRPEVDGLGSNQTIELVSCKLILGGELWYGGSATLISMRDCECTGPVSIGNDAFSEVLDSSFRFSDLQLYGGDAVVLSGSTFLDGSSASIDGGLFHISATSNLFVDAGSLHVDGNLSGGPQIVENQMIRSGGISAQNAGFDPVEVTHNSLTDCILGIAVEADERILVEDNLLIRCGTGIDGPSSSGFRAEDRVLSNTVVDCAGTGIRWLTQRDRSSLWIERNIVVGCDVGISLTPPEEVLFVACNDVWSNPGGNWIGIPNPTGVNGNISEDPFFCVPSVDDFTLASDSPCAPAQQPTCGLIGARDVGCGEIADVPEVDSPAREIQYPNPIRPGQSVVFRIPDGIEAAVRLFDSTGRRVVSTGGRLNGEQTIVWTGQDERGCALASGVYYWRLVLNDEVSEHKMVTLP